MRYIVYKVDIDFVLSDNDRWDDYDIETILDSLLSDCDAVIYYKIGKEEKTEEVVELE
jgi:hypothetical protein